MRYFFLLDIVSNSKSDKDKEKIFFSTTPPPYPKTFGTSLKIPLLLQNDKLNRNLN